ncbi:SdpI family protein [uncultured Anaerococcus sp.]|uniref:SdpI family protein n=1 Tax=uncultured Anaerococcus sp. TaxID=293428 RepID=UPI002889BA36|nr:SdpI family protein [uncultured Anaerococcus sp.]
MGPVIVGDLMLLIFSIYIGIFFIFFHTTHPDMAVGFHIWEACYSEDTWIFANKFAGSLAIGLGVIFYGIIIPILIYLEISREILSIIIIFSLMIFFLLLFGLAKLVLRKKFDLKDNG